VLPIAFLLGAVLGIGRLAEDREVVALGAAGISPARLVPVPLALGVAVAALGLWLSAEVEPRALRAARDRLVEVVKKNVRNDVRAGTFYDQIPGYTLYAGEVRGGRWLNVLVSDRSDPDSAVLALARSGRLEPVGGDSEMRLVLGEGEVHREDAATDEYAVAEFGRGEVVVGLGSLVSDRSGLVRASKDSLAELSREAAAARARGDRAEAEKLDALWHRKVSSPLAVVAFALLAVPLGASRKVGRAFGIGATFAAVIAQFVLLRGGEVLAGGGVLPPALALQLPNLVIGGIGLALLVLQVQRGPGAVR
jgi:lipopolysaccharide export system permease protein